MKSKELDIAIPEIIQDQEYSKTNGIVRGLGILALSVATAAATWAIAANHFSEREQERTPRPTPLYAEYPNEGLITIRQGAELRTDPLVPTEVINSGYPEPNPSPGSDYYEGDKSNVVVIAKDDISIPSITYVYKDPVGKVWYGIPSFQLERDDNRPSLPESSLEWVRKDIPEEGIDYDADNIVWGTAWDMDVRNSDASSIDLVSPEDKEQERLLEIKKKIKVNVKQPILMEKCNEAGDPGQ